MIMHTAIVWMQLTLIVDSSLWFNELNILKPDDQSSFMELVEHTQHMSETCTPSELFLIIAEQASPVPEIILYVKTIITPNRHNLLIIQANSTGITIAGETDTFVRHLPHAWAKTWNSNNIFAPNPSAIYTAILLSNTTEHELALLMPHSGRNQINTAVIAVLQRRTIDIVAYTIGENSVTECMFHMAIKPNGIEVQREPPFNTDMSLTKCQSNSIRPENYYLSLPTPNQPNLCYYNLSQADRFDIKLAMRHLYQSNQTTRVGTMFDVDETIACDARFVLNCISITHRVEIKISKICHMVTKLMRSQS